jgi:hypothetical protein
VTFPTKTLDAVLVFPMRATFPAHLMFLDFSILILNIYINMYDLFSLVSTRELDKKCSLHPRKKHSTCLTTTEGTQNKKY